MDMLNYQEFEPIEPSASNAAIDIFKSWLEELLLWWNEYYWVEFTAAADMNRQILNNNNNIESEVSKYNCFTKKLIIINSCRLNICQNV
jgi:hypothetical protein